MESSPVLLTVGLNRRYSPMVRKLVEAVGAQIDSVDYTVTRTFVPPDHWSLDPVDGGGRLISEGEHFVDLCNLLVGRPPVAVYAIALGTPPDDLRTLCNYALTIHYDGAVANVVFARLTVNGRRQRQLPGSGASMGHKEELEQFVAALRGEPSSVLTWEEASNATLCVFAAQESIRSGAAVDLETYRRSLIESDAGDGG
jgi:polar amino acid transport system substrate-binding protein